MNSKNEMLYIKRTKTPHDDWYFADDDNNDAYSKIELDITRFK